MPCCVIVSRCTTWPVVMLCAGATSLQNFRIPNVQKLMPVRRVHATFNPLDDDAASRSRIQLADNLQLPILLPSVLH